LFLGLLLCFSKRAVLRLLQIGLASLGRLDHSHDFAVGLIGFHEAMGIGDLVEVEDFHRFGPVDALFDILALTRVRTSPSAGCDIGNSRSTSCSGPPYGWVIMAFMVQMLNRYERFVVVV